MPKFSTYKGSILLELFFDATLLLLFIAQAFIVGCLMAYGYIPIPREWANAQLAKKESHGLHIQAEGFRLKINGDFELTGLEIHSEKIRQPILEADGAVLKCQLWEDRSFQFKLDSLLLSNGTLYLPAVYAPNGTRTPILERIAFHLEPSEELLRIDSFAALHQDISLRGTIEWPLKPLPRSDEMLDPLDQFFRTTATALKEKSRFSPFKNPTLTFNLKILEDQSVRIFSRLTCSEFEHKEALGSNFWMSADLRLKENQLTLESPLSLHVDTIQVPRFDIAAQTLRAQVAKENWKDLLNGAWPEFKISAQDLTTQSITLTAPEITINPIDFPRIRFSGTTSGFRGAVSFTGEIDANQKNGTIQAQGNVDLIDFISDSATKTLPPLIFESAPYYHLTLNLSDGFGIEDARFDCRTNNLTAADITVDYLRAQGSFGKGIFTLEDVNIKRNRQWLDLKFTLDTNNSDYRITLTGSAIPYEYNALLPCWWSSIFEDFKFEDNYESLADFIIYGNTKRATSDLFFGNAQSSNITYKDVTLDRGDLIVRGREGYVELDQIDVSSGDGWAKGNVSFTSRRDEVGAPVSIRYNFKSKLPPLAAQKIFGGNISKLISDFEVTELPVIELSGVNFNKAYPQYSGCSTFSLTADSAEEITYKNIPLDHLHFKLKKQDNIIYFRDVTFGYADGVGKATIDILTPPEQASELVFKLSLIDADATQAIHDLPHLDSIEDNLENYESTSISRSGREEGRLNLNLHLHARGPINDPYQYVGHGDFTILDRNLGAIQLLGPLSSLLKNTRFNFTSFNLQSMTAVFQITENDILFNQLRIDGPQTRISANGDMKIKAQELAMKVQVNLFGNVGDPNSTFRKVGNVLTNPIPNILDFDLTGTVQQQKWRSAYDPRKLIPKF
jgi:hypothetical protein